MVSKATLVLCVALAAVVAVQAYPADYLEDYMKQADKDADKELELLKSMVESKASYIKDELKKHLVLFYKLMQYVKEKKEKIEGEKKARYLFKLFVKTIMELKKDGEGYDDDSDDYDGEGQGAEDKLKKLFIMYKGFIEHIYKQKAMEKKQMDLKEKAKKRFGMFMELVKFCKQAWAKKQILKKMSEYIDYKLKAKFVAFKNCFVYGKCLKEDGGEYDDDKDGSYGDDYKGDYGDDDYDEKKEAHLDLFMKMHKLIKEKMEGGDFPDKPDYSIMDVLTKLEKYLKDKAQEGGDDDDEDDDGYGYGGDDDDDDDYYGEGKDKKYALVLFKVWKQMKAYKEEYAKKEKLKELFQKFTKYVSLMESKKKAAAEYAKFKKYQQMEKYRQEKEEFLKFYAKLKAFKAHLKDKAADYDKKKIMDYIKDKFEQMKDEGDEDPIKKMFEKLKNDYNNHDDEEL